MKSVPPRAPVAILGAAAASAATPTMAGKGQVTRVVPSDATGVSTTIVVGAPQSGKSSLVNALLGAPALAPLGGSALVGIPRSARPPSAPASPAGPTIVTTEIGTGPAAVARPVTSAYLSFRHGDKPAAYAYGPGKRGPRPLSLEELRDGDLASLVRGGQARPPRRIDVLHPSELLRRVTLVDTPGVGGFDQAYVDIALDALDGGAALLFITEASAALQPVHLDFLAEVARRGVPVTFVLTKTDAHQEWPAVLAANQSLVHTHAPQLAGSPWYPLNTRAENGAAVSVEEAALGVAGIGVAALRRSLIEPAPGPVVKRPAPAAPTPRVVAGATDVSWMQVLDRQVRSRGVAVAQRLSIDLATVHVRGVQETGSGSGCARLAHVFDRELHALSVRATGAVEAAATAIMRQVFGEILDGVPDDAALARIRRATRRAVAAAESGKPEWDRILLLTATSGVAVTAGRGAVASLTAVKPRPLDQALVPPIAVGLSAGCYLMWQQRVGDRKECQGWLQQTVRVLEQSLHRELAARFDLLREALTTVATDTIDHGVLLT